MSRKAMRQLNQTSVVVVVPFRLLQQERCLKEEFYGSAHVRMFASDECYRFKNPTQMSFSNHML